MTWKLLAVAVATAVVAYELDQHHSDSALARAFNSAVDQLLHNSGGLSQWALNKKLEEDKKKKDVRTEPKDLNDQLALEEAKANDGKHIMKDEIKDPKYPKDEWKKMQYKHKSLEGDTIEIHYWENIKTGEKIGYKFKDYNKDIKK